MNGREKGFLLLTCYLGDPMRKPLTVAQLRNMSQRVKSSPKKDGNRQLNVQDLCDLGYSLQEAERILGLMSQTEQLAWYVKKGARKDCKPITRISDAYPARVRDCLGAESPGSLWAKGELSLLEKPKIALVGSRDLREENLLFAREAGKQAALQGFTLVSGNARGADSEAQNACLEYGGTVISVVADQLETKQKHKRILYLSEDGFDLPFSAQRALSRNRVIHCLAERTLVAQSGWGKGGTWSGTMKNLQNCWSGVFCFADGSPAFAEYTQRGARPITMEQLQKLGQLFD